MTTTTTTTAPTALASMTPVEIDTILAEIWGRIAAVESKIGDAEASIRSARKMARYGGLDRIPALEAKIVELAAQVAVIEDEAAPYEAEYARRPWTRAFLCTASNGHVHKSRACSTTRIRTRFMWLIDYAGKNEAEVVADAGCIACTVCFPSAPVEGLANPTKIFASPEAKAKAEKKAAAEAVKCAGSGTMDYPRETARRGYCSGNYGVCNHCGERVTITSSWKMRAHAGK
jgi:hypothetical protein